MAAARAISKVMTRRRIPESENFEAQILIARGKNGPRAKMETRYAATRYHRLEIFTANVKTIFPVTFSFGQRL